MNLANGEHTYACIISTEYVVLQQFLNGLVEALLKLSP